jgi:hypothetical protein
MARYLVTTRRALRGSVQSALAAVSGEPGVVVLNSSDPDMVQVDASEEAATRLQGKLHDTHFVEPETRRSLH